MRSMYSSFLLFIALLFGCGAVHAGTPAANVEPDGSLLSESRQCFEMLQTSPEGELLFGHTLQTIEATEHEGRAAWRIVVHQKGAKGNFDMRDEFLLRADNLLPISLHNKALRGGELFHEIHLDYGDSVVTGKRIEANGEVKSINEEFDIPRWEGNLWGLTFAALPLAPGERYELPFYQYDKGKGKFIVDVIEREGGIITVRGGTDPESLMEYQIQASPRAELGYGNMQFKQQLAENCSAFK